jgi:Domain of unknown function (DUF3598)
MFSLRFPTRSAHLELEVKLASQACRSQTRDSAPAMAAPDMGPSWDRFLSSHLGDWTGRSLALSPTGALIHTQAYTLSTSSVAPTKSNPSAILVAADLSADGADGSDTMDTRYDADSLFVFEDGSYTHSHRLLATPRILPRDERVPFVIEHALSLSATERVRCFLAYTAENALDAVVILEETRQGLFENRPPLAFTSLVGEWRGQAETLQRPPPRPGQFTGFGRGRAAAGTLPRPAARPRFSQDDLPDALKHPSGKATDGLVRLKTVVSYGWDPRQRGGVDLGRLRRTTKLIDMAGDELGQSIVYGSVVAEAGSLFDSVRCSDDSVMLMLSNASWVSAPLSRARGKSTTSELGCLVTAACRRRITRTDAKWGVASESLVTESLGPA